MTRRLFLEDPARADFKARILARREAGGKPALVLDQTAFYATSGGQPHDTGTLNGVRVLDVVEAGDEIVHVLEAPVEGESVRGEVDWGRRIDHVQQHHGQHLLSAAFIRICDARTISFHLGETTCSIDLDRSGLSPKKIEAAQAEANRVVLEDRPVSVLSMTREEAEAAGARRLPEKIRGTLRVIEVPEFDLQPCSGTHPSSTGKVGAIVVLGTEKYKGGTRVGFVCGGRAVRTLSAYSRTLRSLASKLSVPVEETEEALARRLEEEKQLRRRLGAMDKQIIRSLGKEIFDRGESAGGRRICLHEAPDRDMPGLKGLAHEIQSHGGAIAVLVSRSAKGCLFVAGASDDVDVDLRPILKEVFEKVEGKGGGMARFVQGSFSAASPSDVLSCFRDALAE
jgi:alanyl-tRNA synthetase